MSYPTEEKVWSYSNASGSTLTVLLALAKHADSKTHIAWPSIDTLAKLSRIDRRNVIRHLQKLVQMGELKVFEDRKGRTTKYRVTCGETVTSDETATGDVDGQRGDETVTTGGDASATRTVTVELLKEPLPPVSPPSEAFETFWSTIPKRMGSNPKAMALKSFTKAVKAGTDPSEIIDGARKWRAQCEADGNVGTKFVPQATTWLNQERWNDEYTNPGDDSTERRRKLILGIVGLEPGSSDPSEGGNLERGEDGGTGVSGRLEADQPTGTGGGDGTARGMAGSILRGSDFETTDHPQGLRASVVSIAGGSRHDRN